MPLRVDILTLFPEMFDGFLAASIVGRSARNGLVEFHRTNIRDFATNAYGSVDDKPFGGGPGMVLMCQPVFDAVEAVRPQAEVPGKVVLLTPQGRRMDQKLAVELASEPRLIFIAGHYEGFDERIRQGVDMEVSLGDFVLSGGEVAAMAVIDSVIRLLPGALGKDESSVEESFSCDGLLEYPQYTRPREFRGMSVPDVLVNGDHGAIAKWRLEQAQLRTMQRRPDLWELYRRRQSAEE